jgi:hypothetical protein
MDVIGFVCVSLGSSTVQLHDKVSDVHAHVQRLVSVVKMVTVLDKCSIEEERCVVRVLWAKGLNAKDITIKMCPVYGGKCLSRKAVPH